MTQELVVEGEWPRGNKIDDIQEPIVILLLYENV